MMGKFPRKVKGFKINSIMIDEDELFDSEEEARDSIDIEEVERWQCVTCDEIHEDKDDAYNCCG
jgi:hypothetical protein